ncbi:MAG: cobalamin-dependent protein [Atribacterota bacterium]|jgi:5-methyltetrahydrofolate--homocysteine methyltransferase|nr:cobalamin-dependent protein [Atribacterota bacterium]
MADKLIDNIVNMKEKEALQEVQDMISNNVSVMEILKKCRTAMESVGERYEKGEYFLPELMMAAEIMNQVTEITKPLIQNEKKEEDNLGVILMGTVEGDVHNIGKRIVNFNLEANGFKVIDIGEDISPKEYIEAIKKYNPGLVGLSCLLTVAFDSMQNTISQIEEAGLRDRVKIMIGGAPIDDKVCEYTKADGWGEDAVKAVKVAKQLLGVD